MLYSKRVTLSHLVSLALAVISLGSIHPHKASASAQARQQELPYAMHTIRKSRRGWWTAKASYFHFASSGPVVALANADLRKNASRTMARFMADLKDAPYDEGKPPNAWELDMSGALSVATRDVISLNYADYEGTWGAHSNTSYECHSYGLVHGKAKVLKLGDLFLSGAEGVRQVNQIAMDELRKNHASFVEDGTVKELPPEALASFIITPKGITLLISTYLVASYAEGPQIIEIPYSKLKGINPRGPLKEFVRTF